MNDTFKIGEVALLACNGNAGNAGDEVTIIRGTILREVTRFGGPPYIESFYQIRCVLGVFETAPSELRKKPPPEAPRQQLGEWELCPWQPPLKVPEGARP